MTSLPINIYSVAGVREIDRAAIEDARIPGYTLMTRAGAAALREARLRYPDAMRWAVVCGAGNNAGDGYVLARLAAAEGVTVTVVALVAPDALAGDAAIAYADFRAADGTAVAWSDGLDRRADLIVDAILGSGLRRAVRGQFAEAVAAINAHEGVVVALDIPTGINGDSGAVMGSAVRADLTVTFVGLKAGLFLDAGREYCGELCYAGLDIDDTCRANSPVEYRRLDNSRFEAVLPRRARSAHKGDFGHVLVIGGGVGMPGAVRLCGEAALRAGAGRVSVATAPVHAPVVVASRPELMSHAINDVTDLDQLLEKADVIALGPGLGRSPWAAELVARLAADERAAVWDADALYWLAAAPARAEQRVLTPHPGEAATLLGVSAAAIQQDRRAAVLQLQRRYGGVVVLKGAGTLVSSAAGPPWLCTSGNPGMAAAGMGDALTGIIAALLAQGLAPEDAAAAGVEIHARAGDRAAQTGERGLIASDLIAEIRHLCNP